MHILLAGFYSSGKKAGKRENESRATDFTVKIATENTENSEIEILNCGFYGEAEPQPKFKKIFKYCPRLREDDNIAMITLIF